MYFRRLPPYATAWSCALALFILNAWLCFRIFASEFTVKMESIESSYMSISRWAMDHWSSHQWFPVWYTGAPFFRVYQPGLHMTVAKFAMLLGWTPQHAFHFLTGLAFCLGPVTLFWLCYAWTKSPGFAFTSGLLCTLLSPICVLVQAYRVDTDNLTTGRRFVVLNRYGEGPHTTAVMMIPLVILVIHFAITEQRRWAILLCPFALAALVLTNWPGTIGLTMAIAAYLISRLGTQRPVHWGILMGVSIVAYLIACPWIPPSVIKAVQQNAQQSDATNLGHRQLISFAGMAVVLALMHFVFARFRTSATVRFFAYFSLIAGAVSVGHEWFGWKLLPQSNRWAVEFELAFCGLLGYALKSLYDRLPRWSPRIAALCLFVLFCATEGIKYRRMARPNLRSIDITTTIEYRMAKWFDANMHGGRVFAPGNVSFWMNMFTDTPQVTGCCDQGVPDIELRVAPYAIYTGQNAGNRDVANSILWLKAYGADAVGVTGPHSKEFFRPFVNPQKFEGVLPVLWRDGDDVVYDVQRKARSLAHVLRRDELVNRAPENGLDVQPLVTYVGAMESGAHSEASFQWVGNGHAIVQAELRKGDIVSVQIGFDPGWRATANGHPVPLSRDSLGLTVVDPQTTGAASIDLFWDGGPEAVWSRRAQIFGLVSLALWGLLLFLTRKNSGSRPAAPTVQHI